MTEGIVSIITPVLNGAKYLEECIQSVLNQSYPHIEHIFVDSSSTDGTLEMLASYQAKYPDRIRFISEPDKGAGEACNKGWQMARGDIFSFLGSDDSLCPGAIQTVVHWFDFNQSSSFVFGRCNYITPRGKVIGQSLRREFNLLEARQGINIMPATSAFYRREVIDRVGWFDTLGDDSAYWVRVGQLFTIRRIEDVLSNFRIHPDSNTARRATMGAFYWYWKFILIQKLRSYLGFSFPLLKRLGMR